MIILYIEIRSHDKQINIGIRKIRFTKKCNNPQYLWIDEERLDINLENNEVSYTGK